MTLSKKSFWDAPVLNSRTDKQNVKLPEMIFGYFLGPLLVLAMTSVVATYYLTFYRTSDDVVARIKQANGGHGVERAFDASASDPGRQTAIRATREWGKIAFVGEGNSVTFNPSPDIIHGQKSIYGSWVTSLANMEDLVERLVRWNIHPEDLITHRFALKDADKAYALMASGNCGKVAVVFDGTENAG